MATRTRAYAFIFYPESAPENWLEILDNEHVCTIVSPLHDSDTNPDGSQKKEHYHIMLLFEGVKSEAQVKDIIQKLHGTAHFETVNSVRGYARYMLHLDNPEKHQYDRKDITCLGGADYDEIIHLATDDDKMLAEIMEFLDTHTVISLTRFIMWCNQNNKDWFNLITHKYSHIISEVIKSNYWALSNGLEFSDEGGMLPPTEEPQDTDALVQEAMNALDKKQDQP